MAANSSNVSFSSTSEYRLDIEILVSVASRKPVPIEAVAKSILFLASEKWSGSVNGQVLNVDSGKMGKMMWMKEDCE